MRNPVYADYEKVLFYGTPTTFQIINSYFTIIVMFSSFLILSGSKSKQWKTEKIQREILKMLVLFKFLNY